MPHFLMVIKRPISPRLLALNPHQLAAEIKTLGKQIGFTDVRIARPNTERAATLLRRWQDLDNAGDMHYLQRHGLKRGHIQTIIPDALSIISVSLNYLPTDVKTAKRELADENPYISVYARGRDYHKIMRKMLARFAKAIETLTEQRLQSRAFVDTAPVLDKAYAEQAGIGWTGKHTNILSRDNGSFYFLGELAINLKLPPDSMVKPDCGRCTKCIDVCPTQAIIAPYQLDATRCISYLTIEYDGIIADDLKAKIGNRIYGCDDCQLFCPWNRFAKRSENPDFSAKESLRNPRYNELFPWNEATFLKKLEGSPIRRIGYNRWQRNLAIAMGNDKSTKNIYQHIQALKKTNNIHPSVTNAVNWALNRLTLALKVMEKRQK